MIVISLAEYSIDKMWNALSFRLSAYNVNSADYRKLNEIKLSWLFKSGVCSKIFVETRNWSGFFSESQLIAWN